MSQISRSKLSPTGLARIYPRQAQDGREEGLLPRRRLRRRPDLLHHRLQVPRHHGHRCRQIGQEDRGIENFI